MWDRVDGVHFLILVRPSDVHTPSKFKSAYKDSMFSEAEIQEV